MAKLNYNNGLHEIRRGRAIGIAAAAGFLLLTPCGAGGVRAQTATHDGQVQFGDSGRASLLEKLTGKLDNGTINPQEMETLKWLLQPQKALDSQQPPSTAQQQPPSSQPSQDDALVDSAKKGAGAVIGTTIATIVFTILLSAFGL